MLYATSRHEQHRDKHDRHISALELSDEDNEDRQETAITYTTSNFINCYERKLGFFETNLSDIRR